MNLNEFAKEVHQNAVDHGWWDEARPLPETLALIHSEYSEALEEARAGRPLVYKVYINGDFPGTEGFITPKSEQYEKLHSKPEGIAVELIDGCIRIFDLLGRAGIQLQRHFNLDELLKDVPARAVPENISELVTLLHWYISMVYASPKDYNAGKALKDRVSRLYEAVGIACLWVKNHGEDPEKLLIEKHEYNKTRPYKHGKKF